jgi:hypothetical protein
MQRARTLLLVIMPLVLISASALGWAGSQPSPIGCEPVTAGKLELTITGYAVVSKPKYVTVSVCSIDCFALDVRAAPFAPGDTVVISLTIKNVGTLPATSLTECVSFINTYDKAFTLTVGKLPSSLASGASATVSETIACASGLKNVAEHASMCGIVTFTGEYGYPSK